MRKTTAYIADDGKFFESFNDCAKYEFDMQFKDEVKELISSLLATSKLVKIGETSNTIEEAKSKIVEEISKQIVKEIKTVREVLCVRD
ncbi:MAG: hypothetical protein SOR77_00615 [Peptoniphilus sp.]|uniref:hypothetical protein n=1 Tax=Peptoniphilus sp. TaxID=1971214 RepID=UPI002A7502A7|nr:hypothetical protein [Peptoniphilus sp.]MDY2986111.1 hypothetical protein [Peptoniphilus sp.]